MLPQAPAPVHILDDPREKLEVIAQNLLVVCQAYNALHFLVEFAVDRGIQCKIFALVINSYIEEKFCYVVC